MWLLPSKGRPEQLQRIFDTWPTPSTPVVALLDGKGEGYENVRFPINVGVWFSGETKGFCPVIQKFYTEYPNLPWYGILSDDAFPRTPNWDTELIKEAGDWNIACANDLYMFRRRWTFGAFGGELIHTMGMLAPPGLYHLYIDNFWEFIGYCLGLFRYREDVIIEHCHFSNGKAPVDDTYMHTTGAQDREAYAQWEHAHGKAMLLKIREAMIARTSYAL